MLVSPFGRSTCFLQVGALFFIGAALSAGLVTGGLPQLAPLGVIPGLLGLFVLSFYRDPDRSGPADATLLLSPADGRVTDIGEVEEPHYLGGRALRIGIFLSPLNVHVNRSPAAGVVEKVVQIPGKCLPATGPACIEENEAALIGLKTNDGLRLSVRQVTGALARTIVCPATVGQRLARGERYGMIKLGSRTELILPLDAGFEPQVAIGDVVRGGETVLGRVPARATTESAS